MKQELYKNMYRQLTMTEEQKTVSGSVYRQNKIQCAQTHGSQRAPQSVRAYFCCLA